MTRPSLSNAFFLSGSKKENAVMEERQKLRPTFIQFTYPFTLEICHFLKIVSVKNSSTSSFDKNNRLRKRDDQHWIRVQKLR